MSSAKVEEEPPKEEPKEPEEIKPEDGIDGGLAPSPERVPQMVRCWNLLRSLTHFALSFLGYSH